MCQSRSCRDAKRVPTAHVCRWICLCGNLIREEEQHPQLAPQTLRAIGTCCAHTLPNHMKSRAWPIDGEDAAQSQQVDQRKEYREKEEASEK